MERLTIKAYNYYPDFRNESLANRGANIINSIKNKSAIDFEQFGFHELALNFNDYNVTELKNFAKLLVKQNIKNLIIFCNNQIVDNFKAGFDFLYKNDLLANKKMHFHFINQDDNPNCWMTILENKPEIFNSPTTAFLITGFNEIPGEEFLDFIKILCNKFQKSLGCYRALERIFLISKVALEKQIDFLDLPEKNRLIMPNILSNVYSFFNEINLFLLLLKGADIFEIFEGYSSASSQWLSTNLSENFSYQYAYIRYIQKAERKKSFLIASNNSLQKAQKLYANLNNKLFKESNIFNLSCTFNDDLFIYGDFLLVEQKKCLCTFIELLQEKNDFRITDDISAIDALSHFKINKLSQYKNLINDGIVNTLTNIGNIPVVKIMLQDNSEVSLGWLIGFFYWSLIYEAYLDKISPFDII